MDRQFSKVFWANYDACTKKPRYISNCGGTRSGKSYSILQLWNELIPRADSAGDISSVVSETLPHLKKGVIRDFEKIVGHPLKFDDNWNETDHTYTYPNGAKLEFFSVDDSAKVLGPARKRLFVNECNHIKYETFRQLEVRTTLIIWMDYNPASSFWANEKIEILPNCITIHSTYKDNDFLTPMQIESIERNKSDKNWWRVYGEGKVGQLEGVIYDFEQIDELPEKGSKIEVWGMDFGFQSDPTAITKVYADTGKKELFVQEQCYRTKMLNSDIVDVLKECNMPLRSIPIYADCAEPKSIAEIGRAGFNIKPCYKGGNTKGSKLTFQIQWMQGWKLFVTKDSVNLIKELRNYTWATDKDGNVINYPIDSYNHLLDSLRYACVTHLMQKNTGHYVISI